MGYRFTLESANTVANLTFGKVMSCYRDIYSSPECYEGFMHFLDQFQDNLYSNEIGRYMRSVQRIRETLHIIDMKIISGLLTRSSTMIHICIFIKMRWMH